MRRLGPFFRDVWQLAWPYYGPQSEERWSARALLGVTFAMRLVLVGFSVLLSFWNNAFFNTLQNKDWDSFIALLFYQDTTPEGRWLPGFVWIVALYIIIAVYRIYLVQLLQIRWRRWLTARFIGGWLSGRAYYRISLARQSSRHADYTDNPDQRIAEDLRDFIGDAVVGTQGILFLAVDFIANIVSLVSFLGILWSLSGDFTFMGVEIPGYMVWVALLYAGIGTVLTHLVGRQLVPLNFAKQRVEADFRFALVRVRENTEGIALYGGEAEERRGLMALFGALALNWRALMTRFKYLIALTSGYGQVASIFPIVVVAPRYFSGAIQLGGMMQTVQSFGQVQGAMSWFVDNYSTIASWRATVERLSFFQRAIEGAQRAAQEGVQPEAGTGTGYALHHATLALPDGRTLLENTSIDIPPGPPVLITGRSGSGKSTLFRTFAGIWPFGSGHVRRASGTSLFLPQRPYIPLGTLRHAVAYPTAPDGFPDAEVADALRDAGLPHLIERLDEEDNWTQRLSGGEQQRLALARALLAKPDWLFLDEATASLDPDSEAALYETIRQRLPGTTVVSIAHRPSVAAFHDRHIVLERSGDGPGRLRDVVAQAAD